MINLPEVDDDVFPESEVFVDCCGQKREFMLSLLDNGFGYFVRATERVSGNGGYSFAAYSESGPYMALGRLRHTIRKGLATRYLAEGESPPSLTHEVAVGHITDGGIVIDGRRLSYEDLASILSTYEGWQFNLKIVYGYGAS